MENDPFLVEPCMDDIPVTVITLKVSRSNATAQCWLGEDAGHQDRCQEDIHKEPAVFDAFLDFGWNFDRDILILPVLCLSFAAGTTK